MVKIFECLFFWQFSFFLDEFTEGASFAVLIDEKEVGVGFHHFFELDDVRMVHFGEYLNFVVSELCEFGLLFELFYVHDFDCKESCFCFVLGFVDVSVLS